MRVWIALCFLLLFRTPVSAQQRLIYDDDCSQDVDCVATLPILHAFADRGEIKILAMVANSANPLSAPTLKLFANYAGHPQMPVGANQGNDPSNALCRKNACNESQWTEKLVARFDPGDTRSHYPDCVAIYRSALAKQPPHSVAIVATGFATCLNRLLASPADAVSPLSGAELIKQKVKLLSVMGGKYPAGTEWNFECDAPGFHALFSQWTRQHGYPPVYLNGFANGLYILAGAPAKASPAVNPTRYGLQLAKTDQRPMWDMLSALFAARGVAYQGTTYFTQSAPGTVTVDATTGADRWSTAVDSGHYVLTNAASNETFSALFDGYAHTTGFLAKDPATTSAKK
jgi:Inosine-uridine preferring nucleoside hydrolase